MLKEIASLIPEELIDELPKFLPIIKIIEENEDYKSVVKLLEDNNIKNITSLRDLRVFTMKQGDLAKRIEIYKDSNVLNYFGTNLYVLVKNKSLYSKLKVFETSIDKLELLENDQDTIIRQFKNGILISTCDLNDMSCIMPGTPNDDVSNLGKIDDILNVISQIVK